MFKVIIAGGRDFNDIDCMTEKNNYYLQNVSDVEIVSGGANGADTLALLYADKMNYTYKIFPAEWGEYGKGAGFIRNEQMANYADALIAYWDGKSKGTEHMIKIARKKGLEVRVIKY